jgi:hypothetical protein
MQGRKFINKLDEIAEDKLDVRHLPVLVVGKGELTYYSVGELKMAENGKAIIIDPDYTKEWSNITSSFEREKEQSKPSSNTCEMSIGRPEEAKKQMTFGEAVGLYNKLVERLQDSRLKELDALSKGDITRASKYSSKCNHLSEIMGNLIHTDIQVSVGVISYLEKKELESL